MEYHRSATFRSKQRSLRSDQALPSEFASKTHPRILMKAALKGSSPLQMTIAYQSSARWPYLLLSNTKQECQQFHGSVLARGNYWLQYQSAR